MAIETVEQREPKLDKKELLLKSVIRGEFTAVRRLVERSSSPADVNSKNSAGLSCLQLAIIRGHFRLAEYLIRKGADVQARDPRGWSPLHDAALMDSKSLVRRLIYKGCSPMLATYSGELPIDVAGSIAMEKILCEEMWSKGERKLSRQYYIYLGLQFLRDPSLERALAVSGRHRSVKSALGRIDPNVLGSSEGCENRSRTSGLRGSRLTNDIAGLRGSSEEVRSGNRLEEAVIDRPLSHEYHLRSLSAGAINSLPLLDRSDLIDRSIPTATSVRELRLRQLDGYQAAAIGERSVPKTEAAASSSSPVRKKSCLRQQSSFDTVKTPLLTPTRRVSFAAPFPEPMAVTGIKTTDSTGEERSNPATTIIDHEQSGSDSASASSTGNVSDDSDLMDISHKALQQLNALYERGRKRAEDQNSDSDESLSSQEDAVALLKMKPRKSSIASPGRRASRRRSVTFQPEVLLQEVVTDGDAKAVNDILRSGAVTDVNKMSPAGLTALHQSALDGNLECAQTLVLNGANVNSVDCESWTPLHAAALQGHQDYVRFMLQAGADPTLKNDDGETAYDLAKTGPIRKMLLCAMNGKSPDSDDYSDGEYSGEEEAEYSHAESDSEEEEGVTGSLFSSTHSKQLLNHRTGTHDSSVSPSPDLSDSVFIGNKAQMINLLPPPASRRDRELSDSTSSYGSIFEPELERIHELEAEGDKNTSVQEENDQDKISEDQGISTMEGSSDCSHRRGTLSEDEGTSRDVLDDDLEPGSLDYRFQEAVLNFDEASLHKIGKNKSEVDVNRVNKSSGITALHHAVLEENFSLVQLLVKEYGADVHIKDTDGWTPLHAASAVGSIRIAQFLLENGAKASVLNDQCEFPVDVAGDKAMEKLLKTAMLGPSAGKVFQGVFA